MYIHISSANIHVDSVYNVLLIHISCCFCVYYVASAYTMLPLRIACCFLVNHVASAYIPSLSKANGLRERDAGKEGNNEELRGNKIIFVRRQCKAWYPLAFFLAVFMEKIKKNPLSELCENENRLLYTYYHNNFKIHRIHF